jgi:hypothetical protein
MKNPFKTTNELRLSEDLTSMQTVTTVTLFGITLYRTRKNKSVSVTLF